MTLRLAALLAVVTACTRPGEQRALDESEVGHAVAPGVTVDIADGLAAVRTLEAGRLALWASAPVIDVTIDVAAAADWQITIENVLPDAVLTSATVAIDAEPARARATILVLTVALPAGRHVLHLAPPDEAPGAFRFVAMADIQTALPTVDEVFREIMTTSPRFVVCMGDITDRALIEEYDLMARQLETLPVPFYTTLGNHELWEDAQRYRSRYGRSSFQFLFKDVAFTFVDSGDAGLDPVVEDELDDWLVAAAERTHVFLTHFPPIDPIGIRYGSFRSRLDGHRVLGKLAAGKVDLTLYGHIHTYLAFENAGIPAFVSGGGGAMPERWDGIGRHFLVVDVGPGTRPTVGLHRVD